MCYDRTELVPAIDLLFVDDDPDSATRSRPVQPSRLHGASAANGEEALASAERWNFDVAVFDMMMPGMSGLELLKKFKELHPECEVILLTGQARSERRSKR